jgi:hypothetical protein
MPMDADQLRIWISRTRSRLDDAERQAFELRAALGAYEDALQRLESEERGFESEPGSVPGMTQNGIG